MIGEQTYGKLVKLSQVIFSPWGYFVESQDLALSQREDFVKSQDLALSRREDFVKSQNLGEITKPRFEPAGRLCYEEKLSVKPGQEIFVAAISHPLRRKSNLPLTRSKKIHILALPQNAA